MTTAQFVETSVTVNNYSPSQDYVHPDDQTQPTFEITLGFKPFTTNWQKSLYNRVRTFLQLRWFLLFRFSFFFSSFFYENKKQRTIKFFRTARYTTIIKSLSTLGLQNKKLLQQGAYLPPAPVISAFSFFVFLLEILLREQKATKDQFLRTAWYATIIKSQYLGFTKQKGSATRCVPSSSSGDLCFFLFRFSFGVSTTRTKSSESSISQNRLICHHYKVSVPWFYKTKKIL